MALCDGRAMAVTNQVRARLARLRIRFQNSLHFSNRLGVVLESIAAQPPPVVSE